MNDYLKNVFEQPQELKKVMKALTEEECPEIRQIANLLTVSEEIILTSMGSAYNSLMPMYYALLKKGKKVRLIETSELIQSPELIKKESLYIMMSRSGESREVYDFSLLLKREGCLLVGITMTPDSTLAKNSTIMLYDPSSYDKCICLKAYTSMALCGLVCVSMMNNKEILPDEKEQIDAMLTWMEENKEKVLKEMEGIPLFKDAHSYNFLSRGYGMGVSRAASLWLEEIAFVSGDVMSIDSFYHGPIRSILNSELADNMIVPVFFDVIPDGRTKKIWTEVAEAARASIYFGTDEKQTDGSVCIYYPEFRLQEEYGMILLAMYVQLFAYQCCIVKGYEPGQSLRIPKDRWVVT